FHNRGGGMDFSHASDDSAGEDHGGVLWNVEVSPLSNYNPLPEPREVALDHPRVFVAIARKRVQTLQIFESGYFRLQFGVLLDRKRVGRVEPSQVASSFDQRVFRVKLQRPKVLQVADPGSSERNRSGQFKK